MQSTTKECVSHTLDSSAASHIPLFLPHVGLVRGDGEDGSNSRPFQNYSDIERVMDYPNMPDPPADCQVMHCEAPGSGIDPGSEVEVFDGGISFPKRSAKLSAGYIFLSKPRDKKEAVAPKSPSGSGEKIACIPLNGCSVDFPPGGRRVFREHAHTGARKGYEMAIHVNYEGEKLTCYIVLDSLGQRETWAGAIRLRCDTTGSNTILRPGGIAGSRLTDAYYNDKQPSTSVGGIVQSNRQYGKKQRPISSVLNRSSVGVQKGPTSSGNAELDAAIESFGIHGFKEEKWVQDYLVNNSVNQLPGQCDQLEKWIDVIKNGLRGAVLEQYEYFVEASREMSTMGREVAWIRTLVERQQETLMTMRNIDFGAGFEEADNGAGDDDEYGFEDDDLLDGTGADDLSDASSNSSDSSDDESNPLANTRTPMRTNRMARLSRRESLKKKTDATLAPMDESDIPAVSQSSHVEIAPWITDVIEEASAFIKESRYSDATDLILKAKTEVASILAAHETTPPIVTTSSSLGTRNTGTTAPLSSSTTSISPKKLHKKQQALLQRTNLQLDDLMDRMSKRLAENLRRKNEALKASAKRERADPLSTLAPLVSPVCLNDDAVALHLLVKLGRYQEAATAYAARRSLLLSEW